MLEGLQPRLHHGYLGFEVLVVSGVVEAIFDVEQRIDYGSVPKCGPLVERVKTVDQTGAESRSKSKQSL